MEKLRQQIEQRLSAVTGDACFYYENLATGVCFGHAADKPVVAASVIKLAVLIEAFRQMDADAVRANEMFVIAGDTDKLPSCGALNYLHDGLCVTFRDLCVLTDHPFGQYGHESAHQASGHRQHQRHAAHAGGRKNRRSTAFCLTVKHRPAALKIISRRGRQGCCSNVCTTARLFPGLPAKICFRS